MHSLYLITAAFVITIALQDAPEQNHDYIGIGCFQRSYFHVFNDKLLPNLKQFSEWKDCLLEKNSKKTNHAQFPNEPKTVKGKRNHDQNNSKFW